MHSEKYILWNGHLVFCNFSFLPCIRGLYWKHNAKRVSILLHQCFLIPNTSKMKMTEFSFDLTWFICFRSGAFNWRNITFYLFKKKMLSNGVIPGFACGVWWSRSRPCRQVLWCWCTFCGWCVQTRRPAATSRWSARFSTSPGISQVRWLHLYRLVSDYPITIFDWIE